MQCPWNPDHCSCAIKALNFLMPSQQSYTVGMHDRIFLGCSLQVAASCELGSKSRHDVISGKTPLVCYHMLESCREKMILKTLLDSANYILCL